MSTISNNRYSHFHNPLYKQHVCTLYRCVHCTGVYIVQVTEAIDKIYLKTGVLQYVTHNDVHGYNNDKNNLHI